MTIYIYGIGTFICENICVDCRYNVYNNKGISKTSYTTSARRLRNVIYNISM